MLPGFLPLFFGAGCALSFFVLAETAFVSAFTASSFVASGSLTASFFSTGFFATFLDSVFSVSLEITFSVSFLTSFLISFAVVTFSSFSVTFSFVTGAVFTASAFFVVVVFFFDEFVLLAMTPSKNLFTICILNIFSILLMPDICKRLRMIFYFSLKLSLFTNHIPAATNMIDTVYLK